MTVPFQPDPRTEAVGNGVSTQFPFGFLCLEKRDLLVSIDQEPVAQNAYTVTGLGNLQGGAVHFQMPPEDGAEIVMELAVVPSRATDYQENGDLFARTVNFDFDRIWLALQSAFAYLGRALRLGPYDIDGAGAYRANNNRIRDLGDPLFEQDATNKRYVDYSLAAGLARTLRLGAGDTDGSGAYRAGGNRISEVGDPTAERDAANMRWVLERIARIAQDGTGQAVLDYLATSAGADAIGFLGTTVGTQLRSSVQRMGHVPFADNNVIRDGSVDGFHRHFGQLVEGMNGRLHLFYGRSPQHGLTPGMTTWHCYSDDGGQTFSEEVPVIPSDPDADLRNMSACVTPAGTILLAYAVALAPSAAPTVFRIRRSEDNGATWQQGADWASVDYAYARCYGRIKVVPGPVPGAHRLVMTPYWQSSATPTYRVAVWISDDDGRTWSEAEPIVDSAVGYTENEIVAIAALRWLAVCRSPAGLMVFKTETGGLGAGAWVPVGVVPLTSTDSYVAPTVDRVFWDGQPYVVLGYCNRTNTGGGNIMAWRVALADELFGALGTDAFGGVIAGATDMDNASGYQCPVSNPAGDLYISGGIGYVEFKEFDGGPAYSQVRFARLDIEGLARGASRSVAVAGDAITVSANRFMQTVTVDTEGGAATDDLWTINGGLEGQTLSFHSGSSSRDTIFRTSSGGGGNLLLGADFRCNTVDSWIVLRRCGQWWVEVGRTPDQPTTTPTLVIASGAVTVRPSLYVSVFLIGTEGGTATDDLDTINGGIEGQVIVLMSAGSSADPTIKDGTGNLSIAGDFTMTRSDDTITLVKRGANWYEQSRSDNLA